MKIGVIGSGEVAQTLASGFLKHGHEVTMGTREPAKLADWLARNGKGHVDGVSATAANAELVVLAVKGTASADVLRAAGAAAIAGKTVIDATNPIADLPPVNGVLRFFTTLDNSLMEQLQSEFPTAHFVKAFNSVGSGHMVNPDFADGPPTMFICGNNTDAKTTVAKLLAQLGWESEDMGQAESARAIEPLCMLWCIPGFIGNRWNHAFKLLKR